MLRGVAKGIPDGKPPAPALQTLIDTGLVEMTEGPRYVLTAAGKQVASQKA